MLKIKQIDHAVLVTKRLGACLHFYSLLGAKLLRENGRFSLHFGSFKLNVHAFAGQFSPHAKNACFGSLDLCLECEGDAKIIESFIFKNESKIKALGAKVLLKDAKRQGAKGEMTSLYLSDPDGNLVELCSYAKA